MRHWRDIRRFHNGQMDGWMDGRNDSRMDGRTDGQMDKRTDGQTDRLPYTDAMTHLKRYMKFLLSVAHMRLYTMLCQLVRNFPALRAVFVLMPLPNRRRRCCRVSSLVFQQKGENHISEKIWP